MSISPSSNICTIKVSLSPSILQKAFLPVCIMQSIPDDHPQDAKTLCLLFGRVSPPGLLEQAYLCYGFLSTWLTYAEYMSSILNRLALPLDWAWRALTRNSQRKSEQGREREGKRCYQPWREITSLAEKKESEYAFATETRWRRKRAAKSRSGRAGKITEEMMYGQIWKLQHVERPRRWESYITNESWTKITGGGWLSCGGCEDFVRMKVQEENINWARSTSLSYISPSLPPLPVFPLSLNLLT